MSVGDVEPPTAILWVYHFLAQHFDYLRDCKRAMEFIDKALDHTPTLIEAYMVKARIYKVNFKQQFPMLLLNLSFIVLNETENFEASKCILFVLKKHFTGSENPSKLSFILFYIILFRYFMSIIVTVVLLIVCFYSDV